jgi:uncharacterized protein (TIGR00369 family)
MLESPASMAKHNVAHGHAPHPGVKPRRNGCFACGKDNPAGMRLKFLIDEAARQTICKFKLGRRYQGPPGHAHGGIIATILDEAMGKVNKLSNVVALTRSMNVEFLRPVPLGKQLTVIGRAQSVAGRLYVNVAEITGEQGEVLARSTGTFIAVDPGKMFAKFAQPAS